MAQELKVPLMHVKGISELLRQGIDDEAVRNEQYVRLGLSTERMLRLIDAYIFTEQIVAKRLSLEIEPVNVAQIAHQVVADLKPLALRYETSLSLTITKAMHPAAINSVALTHALYGLLDVAIRSTQSEVIAVSVQHKGGDVVVAIFDDGDPISSTAIKGITKRLGVTFQPSKHFAAGTGLSIYVADCLTEAMGALFAMQHKSGKRTISVTMQQSSQLSLQL